MNTFEFPVGLCLLALVAIAAGTDLRTRRIPNWLILSALALAIAVQGHLHGASGGSSRWVLGMLTGGGLFFPLYLLRGMGAGDVKLMAAVGAFVEPGVALQIAVFTCVIGGVWALAAIVMRGTLKSAGENVLEIVLSSVGPSGGDVNVGKSARAASVGSLPYGVAIALGTLGVMMLNAWQIAF
ncbi:prepilin peptidase [Paraburkholderia sp. A1BS-2L]|uniref:A24 family peptidase n=1 Tax=Paraburkholderia sp. A1BS-2L TaxID=3028373 RepID=UPI003DA85E1C